MDIIESATQDPAAVSAEGTPAPAPAPKPGRGKVATKFIGSDKDSDLAAAIARILAQMTGNALFPAPVPTLDTLKKAGDAFVVAVHGNDGGKAAVIHRDQTRAAVEEVLRELAAYVQLASQGDKLRIVRSGFPAQRERGVATAQPIGAPTGLKARRGTSSGQVHVRCASVPTARLYQWRYASAQAPGAWTVVETSSATSTVLEGLAAGALYTLQVRAYGKRGTSDWSEGVSLIAS